MAPRAIVPVLVLLCAVGVAWASVSEQAGRAGGTPSMQCTFHANLNISGPNLVPPMFLVSSHDCCRACQENNDCLAAVYNHYYCHLKASTQTFEAIGGTVITFANGPTSPPSPPSPPTPTPPPTAPPTPKPVTRAPTQQPTPTPVTRVPTQRPTTQAPTAPPFTPLPTERPTNAPATPMPTTTTPAPTVSPNVTFVTRLYCQEGCDYNCERKLYRASGECNYKKGGDSEMFACFGDSKLIISKYNNAKCSGRPKITDQPLNTCYPIPGTYSYVRNRCVSARPSPTGTLIQRTECQEGCNYNCQTNVYPQGLCTEGSQTSRIYTCYGDFIGIEEFKTKDCSGPSLSYAQFLGCVSDGGYSYVTNKCLVP